MASAKSINCVGCGVEIPVITCSKRCQQCRRERALDLARRQYQKHKHKLAQRHKARYSDDPDRYRGYHYKHRYGLTREDALAMHEGQGGCCAICKTPVPMAGETRTKLAVIDHCHATGKVRGILCRPCNLLLGNAKDSKEILLAAISYLGRAA